MDRIAVCIPCYNEAKTIEKVVKDTFAVLPDATVYVYDNNSTDGTAEIAEKAGAVVRHEYCQGKGNVIRRMFREIDALCYLMIDGDDTYPLESAPEMVSLVLEKGMDMVVGDRLSSTYFTENKCPFHNFGNSLMRWSINTLFKSDVKDILTGYRAFSFEFVKTYPVVSTGFEIETEMTIHAVNNNMAMSNVIVDYRDRPEGSESKLNTYSDGFRVIRTLIKLFRYNKPFVFFSSLAFVLAVLAICFVIPVISDYVNTGMVERFPTLFVCCFVMLSAIQSLFSGMILSSVASRSRKDHEFRMQVSDQMKKQLMEKMDTE